MDGKEATGEEPGSSKMLEEFPSQLMLFRGDIVHFSRICTANKSFEPNLIMDLFILEINANCSDEV